MATYSISQLAALAGVSVRTLHHYDAIGLLQSAGRSNGGYRLYNQHQVLQLQQILMFRELEYPLAQIQQIMQQPDYDLTLCLRQQQQLLAKRINHLQRLHSMLDRTIQQQESGQMTTSAELFNQFSQATLREEAVQRWGETAIRQSEQQVAQLSTAQQQQLTVEGEQIAMGLAQCLHLPADAAGTAMGRPPAPVAAKLWPVLFATSGDARRFICQRCPLSGLLRTVWRRHSRFTA